MFVNRVKLPPNPRAEALSRIVMFGVGLQVML